MVVVTGASTGIGLAITRGFLKEGAKVVGGSRHPAALEQFVSTHDVVPVVADFSKPEGAEELVQKAMDTFGRVAVLVNNVGVALAREGLLPCRT